MPRHSTKLPRVCSCCATLFTAYPSSVRKGGGRFCSRACAVRARKPKPVGPRFWSRVDKQGPIHPVCGQCWSWTSRQNEDGYGSMRVNGKETRVHRVSWEIHNGPIPGGLHVLHRCDNPSCVNPAHLFLGTHNDNMADMYAKQRRQAARGERNGSRTKPERCPRGERQGLAVLTAESVLKIRDQYNHGASLAELGRTYGVDRSTISAVVTRETWKHV
jgi:hypothetical protein